MTQTRRLAAILAADVAGYSRLMGADEEGTLERLKALRRELVDPTVDEHRGRIVKTTGDGLLIEFGSVVDAVRCATAWQDAMAERSALEPAESRIAFVKQEGWFLEIHFSNQHGGSYPSCQPRVSHNCTQNFEQPRFPTLFLG